MANIRNPFLGKEGNIYQFFFVFSWFRTILQCRFFSYVGHDDDDNDNNYNKTKKTTKTKTTKTKTTTTKMIVTETTQIVNRPCVAGAVLQTALSLNN